MFHQVCRLEIGNFEFRLALNVIDSSLGLIDGGLQFSLLAGKCGTFYVCLKVIQVRLVSILESLAFG